MENSQAASLHAGISLIQGSQLVNEKQHYRKEPPPKMGRMHIKKQASPKRIPVYLNIYDLTPLNGYLYWFGLGIFHSGIEAHGVEYGFGAHDFPSSGVFEVEPRGCPGFRFRKAVYLGSTRLGAGEFREFVERMANDYNGDSYHLIVKNCNHFTNDMCIRLTGSSIPGWVNRLARLGQLCNCLLPEALQASTVQQTPEYQTFEERLQESDEGKGKVEIESEKDQLLHLPSSSSSSSTGAAQAAAAAAAAASVMKNEKQQERMKNAAALKRMAVVETI